MFPIHHWQIGWIFFLRFFTLTKSLSHIIDPWDQFNETKLSVNSSEVERNLLPRTTTRDKVSIEILENSASWNFTLNFCIMKLAPSHTNHKSWRSRVRISRLTWTGLRWKREDESGRALPSCDGAAQALGLEVPELLHEVWALHQGHVSEVKVA